MPVKKLLVTQSFIVDNPGSYWDYRDYIFSFCSNLSIKDCIFRLNIERGGGWLEEFTQAASHNNFSDFIISNVVPDSWAAYMINEIEANQTVWTMPFPGDHIYINDDQDLFTRLLDKAEALGADAVAYSHIQDWDYLLDWGVIEKLYEDDSCVMINWGHKYKFYRNHKLIKDAINKIGQFIMIPPVPGYLVYKSDFFKSILKAIPFKTKRWQDMEYSPAKEAYKFKVLIPKQCLYRHVHGYWLEVYLRNIVNGLEAKNLDGALKSIYLRSNYDWRTNKPSIADYKKMTIAENAYFRKYFSSGTVNSDSVKSESLFCTGRSISGGLIGKVKRACKIFFYNCVLNNLVILKKIGRVISG